MRAFILCAGDGKRWDNYLGLKKQLIIFNKETLIERTVRILNQYSINDIFIVTKCSSIDSVHCSRIAPKEYSCIAETLLSSSSAWGMSNIVLLGDVFYTNKAIAKIVHPMNAIQFYGRPWPSRYTNCVHGEIFGFSFKESFRKELTKHLSLVANYHKRGGLGNLWNIYQSIIDAPFNSKVRENSIFKIIDDFTEDFDTPNDYQRYSSKCNLYASCKPWQRKLLMFFLNLVKPWYLLKIPQKLYTRKPVPWDVKV